MPSRLLFSCVSLITYLSLTPTTPLPPSSQNSKAVAAMVTQFNARYGLQGDSAVTFKDILAMYTICIYEQAIHRHSVWCRLFSNGELKLFEYVADIRHYMESYDTRRRGAGSAVMTDVVAKMTSAMQADADGKPIRSTLYFS